MAVATEVRSDTQIRADVEAELKYEPRLDPNEIGVAVKEGVVTLTGWVDSYMKKVSAEEAAHRVRGVKAVANDIEIRLATERTDADIAAAYEYTKGRFVVLTKEDFRAAALEKTRTIDIRSFVHGQDIDDRFFETSYYLLPSRGGARAYALLREAMRAARLVGIATIVLRDVQHLAALEVVGNAIVLTQMRYPEELVDASLYSFPDGKDLRKPEIEMARTLVEHLAGQWNPSQYADQYRDNLMRIIRARMKGEKATLVEGSRPQPAEVVDLMERLRQAIDAARRRARKRTGANTPTGRSRRQHAA